MGCSTHGCDRAHEYYKNPDQLSPSMWTVLIKRGGFKKRPRIEDKQVSGKMKEIRTKSATEKREKMTQQGQGQRAAGNTPAPECYAQLDFVDLESELRKAAHGPDHAWAETLPQNEIGARAPELADVTPDITEANYLLTLDHMKQIEQREELKFLRDCSPRLSSYTTAIVLQDMRAGKYEPSESIDRALHLAMDKGLPSLQLDAQRVLDTQTRAGRLADQSHSEHEVVFGCPADHTTHTVTPARVAQTKWNLWDYGDTLPTKPGDPILDVYQPGVKERNKCLLIHLAAALLWAHPSVHQKPRDDTPIEEILRLSRDLRYRQFLQAKECLATLGEPLDVEPLALVELRSNIHDMYYPHHDRGHRSIICFPPEELAHVNLAIIRAMPSGRYTVRRIESTMKSGRWAYLVSYRGHMRMAIPVSGEGGNLVRNNPNSVSRPVGWEHLVQLGGAGVTIGRRALLKCPHCNAVSVRLPAGVEGAMVGKSLMLSDVELRSFSIKKPWGELTSHEHSVEAREAWMIENSSPPLDNPPKLSSEAEEALVYALQLVPSEDSPFDYEVWTQVAHATDALLRLSGGMSVAAHAYTCRWRSTRHPTTLTPAGLKVFEGWVGDTVWNYANEMATVGCKAHGGSAGCAQ